MIFSKLSHVLVILASLVPSIRLGMQNTSYVFIDGWNHLDFAEFSFTNIPAGVWHSVLDLPAVGMVCSGPTED